VSHLEAESNKVTSMLAGKVVAFIRRYRASEVLIEFTDGSRLVVDKSEDGLELSITGDFE
jgi:hypothetical protein